ncbi:universal stress protein [Chitinophaga vietnamensis]|uniref:universal stress protein n=1 Tax=Chitinophaga vietnamensis TaxID=2593957 RepID=UPI001177F5BF|nr:universal stress protein [Chitinophaga vietnamensis]
MKKILLATDGNNFSEGAFAFARKLNEREHVLLTGIFLPSPDYTYPLASASPYVPLVEEYAAASVEPAVEKFLEACVNNGLECHVHKNLHAYAMAELKRETRFADLLIVCGEKFFDELRIAGPDEMLSNALHQSECPVVITPEGYHFPESVILSYDGSAASAFAIKSFAYLFPDLCNKPAILIYCNEKESSMPEEENITELVKQHFTDLTIQKLDINPKKYFDTWLRDIKLPILVTGAYGRTGVSRLLKQSFAAQILNEHRIPVFIAHR